MPHKLTLILTLLCSSLISQVGFSDDWPQWGGPEQDLIWRETGIVKTLPTTGLLPRVWSTPIGEGYAGPAVAEVNSRWCIFVTDRIFKQRVGYERVLCLDAETGKPIWKHEYPVEYSVSYPAGPRSTPVINDGRVYTLGAQGHFFCFDAATGNILWSKNFVEDYGTKLPTWGMVAAPLVDGDQLITLVGGKDNSLVVSFDKATGKELWRALDDRAVGYAPPVIFTFGGKRELIVWHPTAVSALEPKTGKLIWEVPYGVRYGLSIATPRKVGNRLFVASFYNGPRMIEVSNDGKQAKIVWSGNSDSEIKTDGLHPIMMTPIFDGTHIYGVCSYGQLRCLDASNGRRLWETEKATGKGRWWNAFIIPHEDRYFLHNEQGDLIIANLTPQGYEEISRAKLIEPTRRVQRRMTIWSHPAFALKSVFARNDKEIIRVDLSAKK
ncbi:outer membrane biogenesis protein BamB [Gimesia alba]|uniref:Outer membrane biogenesis protein BamB n=1 Tax=Gimesia alba TaxID=2527973 RepID=A0A517RP57_9PLAN|nr:PQQ-binding-like beta-propeller repeat protein [Gimesia alba]QDT45612.1 outer membrane biogenesis protein BamB [Gimesia alba]